MKDKCVLVCPAGNLEALKVAVQNGADAVYLGVEGFNARSKAGFSREDFLEGVRFAHLFGVKIFVTLNILVKDSEIEKVLDLADFVYLNGADSLIVQDWGLYYILKNRFKADIHLSTQAGIHNLYGCMVCENKLEAKHVVLSRETLLEDIKKIRKNTNLNLEFFVQGALCVAFSGNCYYSSMLTGGSGNRGTCYQFCRKKYEMLDCDNKKLKKGFLLSPSDISMLDNLEELHNAGINYFKIEGRNRRSAYVGGVTRIYSQALKGIYTKEYKNVLKQLFYRGEYNNLYLQGENDIINPEVNNHVGIRIGEITKIVRGNFDEVYFTSNFPVDNEDTLKVFENAKEICTTTINDLTRLTQTEYVMTTTNKKLRVGQILHLICDNSLENEILEEKKYLEVKMQFDAYENQKATLTVRYKDIEVICQSENILSKAENQPLTKEVCFNQLSKLGDTVFRLRELIFNSDNVFIPLSVINKIRRDALELLKNKIIKNNTPIIEEINFKLPKIKNSNENMLILEIGDSIPDIKANKLILPLSNFDEKLRIKVENIIASGNKAYITLPIIARGRDLEIIDKFIFSFPSDKLGVVSNNLYGLHYLDYGYEVVAGEYMNAFNSYSVQYLKDLGVSEVILSPEVNLEQIETIKNGVVKMYGDMYYMCFTHCPKRTVFGNCKSCNKEIFISDEKNSKFNIQHQKMEYCYNYLVSNNTLNIIGEAKPKRAFLKVDEDNVIKFINDEKFLGTKNKKFTYGLLYKEI